MARVSSWGKVTGLVKFVSDPLWKVNPHRAIAVYYHRIRREFWAIVEVMQQWPTY